MLWRYNVFVTILLRPLAWMTRAPGWLAHNIKPGAGRREVRRLEHGWPRVARVLKTTPLTTMHIRSSLTPPISKTARCLPLTAEGGQGV